MNGDGRQDRPGGAGERRFADSALEGTGFEPSVPRDTTNLSMSPLLGSPPTEKSERRRTDIRSVGPFPRGTDGSNPVPSSAESANHRFLSSRQAITCAGTYQRLQGRRVQYGRGDGDELVHAPSHAAARGVSSCASIDRHPLYKSFRVAPSNANQFPPFVAGCSCRRLIGSPAKWQ